MCHRPKSGKILEAARRGVGVVAPSPVPRRGGGGLGGHNRPCSLVSGPLRPLFTGQFLGLSLSLRLLVCPSAILFVLVYVRLLPILTIHT